MRTYRFSLVLADLREISDDLADRLFEAGCTDGSPWSSEGMASVDFDREAESLEHAIRSAIADVQKAGCRVARVFIDPEDLALAAPGENTQTEP